MGTVTTIFAQVIERLEEEFDADLLKDVLSLLVSARRGLSGRESQKMVANRQYGNNLFPMLRQL